MSATQWARFSTINLGSGTNVLNVVASGNISAAATPTVSNVTTGNLTGTSGNDNTLAGAQLDAIIIGAGAINLGAGTDTINLTSTSADLNTLGATNASIQGVEAISAATAGAGSPSRSRVRPRASPSQEAQTTTRSLAAVVPTRSPAEPASIGLCSTAEARRARSVAPETLERSPATMLLPTSPRTRAATS